VPRPKNIAVTCTIRQRKDCARWELIIRDPFYGKVYGGLHKDQNTALNIKAFLLASGEARPQKPPPE